MRRSLVWATAVAVAIALTGATSYAAGKVIISSSSQVKDGSLKAKDLSKKSRTQLTGQTGPAGATGPAGPAGPSNAYGNTRTTSVELIAGSPATTIVSVAVPAGSYAVSARLQGRTGNEPNPGNNFRFDCNLVSSQASFDSPTYRVGVEPLVERNMNYQGVGTLAAADTIQLLCAAGNGHDLSVISAQLTAIRVGAVG